MFYCLPCILLAQRDLADQPDQLYLHHQEGRFHHLLPCYLVLPVLLSLLGYHEDQPDLADPGEQVILERVIDLGWGV